MLGGRKKIVNKKTQLLSFYGSMSILLFSMSKSDASKTLPLLRLNDTKQNAFFFQFNSNSDQKYVFSAKHLNIPSQAETSEGLHYLIV